mgnify:FL=1
MTDLMCDFYFEEVYDWDKAFIRRLYRKDPERYEAAYLHMFNGVYNQNHFPKTIDMRLR